MLTLETGTSGVSTLPADLPSRQGYEALERSFGTGGNDPVLAVAEGPTATSVGAALFDEVRRLEGFGRPQLERSSDREATLVTAPVAGDPNGQAADVCALATARGLSKAFYGKRFHRHYDDDLGTVLFQVWDDDDDRWRTFFREDVDDDGEADVKFKVRIKRYEDLLFRAVYLGVHDDIRGSISRVVEID